MSVNDCFIDFVLKYRLSGMPWVWMYNQIGCAQICGSDGKTYCNECHLQCGQCEERFDPDVTKVSEGPCSRVPLFRQSIWLLCFFEYLLYNIWSKSIVMTNGLWN